MLFRTLIIALLLILADFYAYRGLRSLFSHHRLTPFRKFVLKVWWLIDLALVAFSIFWIAYVRGAQTEDYITYRRFYVLIGAFLLVVIPKMSFFLFVFMNDFRLLGGRVFDKVLPYRARFLRPLKNMRLGLLFPVLGLVFAAYMFSVTVYGFSFGRKNFQVEEVEIWFDDLPESFDGYRLVQFSDAHLGSFTREERVADGLKLISSLQPDLIVFTGDLVNNGAREAEKFIPVFRNLQAPDGVYSILGNHDFGDYRTWGTIEKKDPDTQRLVEVQTQMGFRVLLNEHVFIKQGNDSIMLAGVENWGMPPFEQHGDLQKTLGESASFPFKILLSHDPSHWREQIIPATDVELTLSGHTHGMQFGISNQLINWSPVKYKYNEWSGLYSEGEQQLYVNRGFGFLSIPGRVGMPPEITLIVLRKGKALSPEV
ncbi:MAG: metallophosphoesterase [Bacteroides sp.]|jgi:predicted MPP superfamily phosphohydrolase|nr:metallophosphoesterase [Bacteroides sp.]